MPPPPFSEAALFFSRVPRLRRFVDSSWNVMAHDDAREGKWRGNWRMECVASTLHTTSEHGVCSITTAHAHTSAASSRLNWRPRRFKWTRVRFAERRNLVTVRVPSHFNWPLLVVRVARRRTQVGSTGGTVLTCNLCCALSSAKVKSLHWAESPGNVANVGQVFSLSHT